MARKVSMTSRRAFWGDLTGNRFRPGGCLDGDIVKFKVSAGGNIGYKSAVYKVMA